MKLDIKPHQHKWIKENWDELKILYNGLSKGAEQTVCSPINNVTWSKPKEVLWLYTTNNAEDYDGSQTQIGIKDDLTIVWGFFSHCSCFGYESYGGDYADFVNTEETFKMYEMEGVDNNILTILKERLDKIYLQSYYYDY